MDSALEFEYTYARDNLDNESTQSDWEEVRRLEDEKNDKKDKMKP